MNKYVKKGLCLVLATGLIASSFAGCAKVNYVTNGAIKAIHQIKDGSWQNQTEGEEAGSSDDTSVLEKPFEAGTYGGVEFKSLEDVANYYKEAYDYTKSLTAEYTNQEGGTETFYKLLGNEKINVGSVMIDGKENAVNSVNLTDGIDGLCSSVTTTVAIAFIVISYIQGFAGLNIFAGALLGGVLGFLCWNWNPAKTFMGDTGSLFLGGMVVALGYLCKCPIILLPIGIVYVCETMSDIIQIGYFKITHGKRIFKMAPIHHHFEMCGWKEKKICVVFSTVNAIGCAIGVLLLYFGNFAK